MLLKMSISSAFILIFGLGLARQSRADVESITISSEDKIPSPRWMYGKGEPPKGNSLEALLAGVKYAQLQGEYAKCLSQAASVRNKVKGLQAWLAVAEIDCATKLPMSAANTEKLAQAIDRAEKNPAWLLKGAQAPMLRLSLIQGYSGLMDLDIKNNRARAWRSLEKVQEYLPFMDEKLKAKLWKNAGELAFIQQRPEAARDFIRRSLNEVDTDEIRDRLAAIEATISSGSPDAAKPAKSADVKAVNPVVESSRDELELVDRITTSMKSGDLVPAVEDAAKLIRGYPGGTRAKWASDRILDAYSSLTDKNDPKYTMLREQMLKQLERVDADRLADWAKTMFARGQFQDALVLSRKALETLTGARTTGALDLAAKSALATDQYDIAYKMDTELILKDAGTSAARDAILRSGLIDYRLGRFSQSIANFEKLISLPQSESLEVIGRYWLWRSLQKSKSDRANLVADELMLKFPFSYYGLRARYERNANLLEWNAPVVKAESKLWLTGPERLAWEKLQILLKSGWLEEAQAELRELPPAFRTDDKAVRGLLWAAAGQFLLASRLTNEAWDDRAELRSPPFIFSVFPNEFSTFIDAQASSRKISRYLVRGLIKQESGFNTHAKSSSNALGLMQMIPPTAKEIATDLKLGPLQLPDDMFEPKRNIQMGTYYISRMISRYQGQVPLALAAYNAGPTRIDRWIHARPSLKNLATVQSSAPDDELWIDELPYWETCFYVKAILRNILIYKVLDLGRVQIGNPLWSADQDAQ